MPLQKLSGGPFFVLYRNVGFPEQNLTQGNQSAKIRLAFHFVERKYLIWIDSNKILA